MMENQMTNTAPRILPSEQDGKAVHATSVALSPIRYVLYARKSSEDDERQALSIDSQVKEMLTLAEHQGIIVVETRTESHSAKYSGQRPVFNQLIEDLRTSMFDGVLTWATDRLSRNAGDLGSIVDLIDSGRLREIRTHGQTFTNTPNDKFLLMILGSQAKLENDNRGINVKRGMKTKCELGFRPNMTPIGYVNDHYSGKGMKQVFIDKKRAPFVAEAFQRVADGASGRDIYNWFKNVGMTTRKDKLVTLSMVYKMLNNTYYCGLFEFPIGSGKWYKGSYKPIISRELFDQVQKKMAVAPKSKPGTKKFDYTKLDYLKCGSCGSGITAQEKFKETKKHGLQRYVYYHCTQSKNYDCTESYLREEKLTEAFSELLSGITPDEVRAKDNLQVELDKFIRLSVAVRGNNDNPEDVNMTGFASYIFSNGTRLEKRALLSCLNQTLYLKNKEVVLAV
jgi:site-specific DNA recombinase